MLPVSLTDLQTNQSPYLPPPPQVDTEPGWAHLARILQSVLDTMIAAGGASSATHIVRGMRDVATSSQIGDSLALRFLAEAAVLAARTAGAGRPRHAPFRPTLDRIANALRAELAAATPIAGADAVYTAATDTALTATRVAAALAATAAARLAEGVPGRDPQNVLRRPLSLSVEEVARLESGLTRVSDALSGVSPPRDPGAIPGALRTAASALRGFALELAECADRARGCEVAMRHEVGALGEVGAAMAAAADGALTAVRARAGTLRSLAGAGAGADGDGELVRRLREEEGVHAGRAERLQAQARELDEIASDAVDLSMAAFEAKVEGQARVRSVGCWVLGCGSNVGVVAVWVIVL